MVKKLESQDTNVIWWHYSPSWSSVTFYWSPLLPLPLKTNDKIILLNLITQYPVKASKNLIFWSISITMGERNFIKKSKFCCWISPNIQNICSAIERYLWIQTVMVLFRYRTGLVTFAFLKGLPSTTPKGQFYLKKDIASNLIAPTHLFQNVAVWRLYL